MMCGGKGAAASAAGCRRDGLRPGRAVVAEETGEIPAGGTVFTKVRIEISKVLTVFSKVLTVFPKVLSVFSLPRRAAVRAGA